MSDCLFCKMVAGDIKPDVVYEDDTVLAFRDINPQAPHPRPAVGNVQVGTNAGRLSRPARGQWRDHAAMDHRRGVPREGACGSRFVRRHLRGNRHSAGG